MSTPALPEYVAPYKPVPQVTPFTYRDGTTMLKKLDGIVRYINRSIVPFINDNFSELADDFEEQVNILIAAVNAAIDSVINDSVEVQDVVIAANINNESSATTAALEAKYALKTVTDALEALVNTGRLSETELDAAYAAKSDLDAISDIINTGRLSEASLDNRYSQRSQVEVHAPDPTGNVTTDTNNIQSLITAMTGIGGIIRLQPGTYKVTSLAFARDNKLPQLMGRGMGVTYIEGNGTNPVITVEGNSGAHNGHVIRDFTIQSTSGLGIGLRYYAICGAKAIDIQIQNVEIGLQFYNGAGADFTEFCTFEGFIESTVKVAVDYAKGITGGSESFHGSGLVGRTVINQPAGATLPSIRINAGCIVYNAPMSATIFGRTSNVALIQTRSARPATFYGDLRIECFSANILLSEMVADALIPPKFAGSILALGNTGLKIGAIQRVKSAYWFNGGYLAEYENYDGIFTVTAPGATPTLELFEFNQLVAVRVIANNYMYNALVYASRSPYNPSGVANVVSVGAKVVTAGYADPTFTIDNYKLVHNSAVIPAGATIEVAVVPLSGSALG